MVYIKNVETNQRKTFKVTDTQNCMIEEV